MHPNQFESEFYLKAKKQKPLDPKMLSMNINREDLTHNLSILQINKQTSMMVNAIPEEKEPDEDQVPLSSENNRDHKDKQATQSEIQCRVF